MITVKFPHVKVELVGQDGNAFSIIGRVCRAIRKAKVSEDDITEYQQQAMAGDYNHLLRVTMETVDAH